MTYLMEQAGSEKSKEEKKITEIGSAARRKAL